MGFRLERLLSCFGMSSSVLSGDTPEPRAHDAWARPDPGTLWGDAALRFANCLLLVILLRTQVTQKEYCNS